MSSEKNPFFVVESETETAGTMENEFPFTIETNSKFCEEEIKQELRNIISGIQNEDGFISLIGDHCECDYKQERIDRAYNQRKAAPETETAGTTEVIENTTPIVHKGFEANDPRQKYVQYAYKLGGIDFVTMLECENGNRDIKAIGDGGHAFGLCQMNTNYHKLPEGYKDIWQVQIEYCYEKWSSGTKFYGPSRKIKGQRCSNYVLDRFIINNVE